MEKMNVIWKASKPQYIGCGDDVEVRRFQGVATFEAETFHEICAKVEQWMSDASVDYGEECGTFHVFGGFLGDVSDFMSGKSDFYGEKELWNLISHTIEDHKNAELENKAMEEMWEIQCSR